MRVFLSFFLFGHQWLLLYAEPMSQHCSNAIKLYVIGQKPGQNQLTKSVNIFGAMVSSWSKHITW